MKQAELAHTVKTTDWTTINLLDYDFEYFELQEAQYILSKMLEPWIGEASTLQDMVTSFNKKYQAKAYIEPNTRYNVKLPKSQLFGFISYVLWTSFKSKNKNADKAKFMSFVASDSTVADIIKSKFNN